jgi:phosphatidylserine/phosphatidylglycerophosphate/cardiolipin synthase-like enzyme
LAEYFAGLLSEDRRLLRQLEDDDSETGSSEHDTKYTSYIPVQRFSTLRIGGESPSEGSATLGRPVEPMRVLPVLTPDNYMQVVPEVLASARESIDIVEPVISLLSDDRSPNVRKLLDAIKDARAGNPATKLRVILGPFAGRDMLERIVANYGWIPGKEIRFLNPRSGLNCTNKLIIVDRRACLVHSANWTEAGVSKNRDFGLLMDPSDVAAYFGQIFQVDWDLGRKTAGEHME